MKQALVALFVVLAILTAANLYYVLVRGPQPNIGGIGPCRPVSRDTLTDVRETPRVIGHRIPSRGVLELVLCSTGQRSRWLVTPDQGRAYEVNGPHPQVKMLDRKHTFQVTSMPSPGSPSIEFTFTIDYCPLEIYAAAAQTHDDNYFITEISIPVWANETYSLNEWCGQNLGEDELEGARQLVQDIQKEGTSTLERMESLSERLMDLLDTKRGIPSDRIQYSSPLEMYRLALAGESGIWCTNFASIYHLFSNAIGIQTRQVCVGGILDEVKYSGHALCESYVPEQSRWACVDLTSRMLYVKDRDGRVMDSIDLAEVLRANSVALEAVIYKDGNVETVNYADVCWRHRYYFSENSWIIYGLPWKPQGALMRYLTRPSNLVIANHDLAYNYVRRLFLMLLWGVSVLSLLGLLGWIAVHHRRARGDSPTD